MYLRIVSAGPLLCSDGTLQNVTSEALIGPFASKKEREDYRQEWITVLGNISAIITNHDTLPKSDARLMPVATAKKFLGTIKNFLHARG